MKNVYFDACDIAIPGMWEDKASLIGKRIRQIGTNRVLCGSEWRIDATLLTLSHQLGAPVSLPVTASQRRANCTHRIGRHERYDLIGSHASRTE
jgi:hypothetical protein